MRATRSLRVYSILLIFLTTFTAAWPWPRWLPERDSLIVRQDSSSTAAQPTSTQGSSAPSSTADSKSSATDNKSSDSNNSGSQTATGTQSGGSASGSGTITKAPSSDSSTAASSANHTSYDASNPAGGISLMTPAVTSGSQYYKVGNNITFGWNYTSILATPTAVNVMATCTANNQLYTIAANQTVSNATGLAIWDTGNYQATAVSDPLLTQTYTLIIYDAASSIDATAEPGYLAVYNQYTFGMYTPQPYTGLDGWVCATCSAGFGGSERMALGLMVGMVGVTVLSFGWFVNGLGVVW